eukprot:CAMPEP_0183300572 /NCGR_PEP_ID=MMETSP0160_2-20130417/6954_1 /TAXON_ID=2839 ORGANISM="Odontella Sinensis, Strain Grunow 1884" /NCGR_SAMPLE_ID=MMETSP0160_2 /ASSEMBLY_ACC=CAM_ASM_000250 /LENGTH=250 /DNA_ID=CAMNT_0025463013 /DNA_START=183 /DNA_END=935 /DNA_ORIENTATION=+
MSVSALSFDFGRINPAVDVPMAINKIPEKRKKMKLRFQDEPTILSHVPCRVELTADEKRSLWWQQNELSSIRQSAKVISKKVRQMKIATACLELAYETAGLLNDDICAVNGAAFHLNERVKNVLTKELTKWSLNGHSCRGLEKISSMHLYKSRMLDSRLVVNAILQEQMRLQKLKSVAECKSPQSKIIEDCVLNSDAYLGHLSLQITKKARNMAQLMGTADAMAVLRMPSQRASKSQEAMRKAKCSASRT